MWVCKAKILGDGLAVQHHRWEQVLLGRAAWMPGALLGSQQAIHVGARLYLHTHTHPDMHQLYVCCMCHPCGAKGVGAGCPPTLLARGRHPACRGDTGGHREGAQRWGMQGPSGRGRAALRVHAPGRGDFLHLFLGGHLGGHLFLFLIHV